MVVSMSAVSEAGTTHAGSSPGGTIRHGRMRAVTALLPAGHSWTVTLVTGDVVQVRTVAGRPPLVTVSPGAGRRGRVAFSKFVDSRGDIEVIPLDVAPLIGRVLDPALFNVTTLILNGDDDAHRAFLPLIVQGRPTGTAALPMLVRGVALASIGAIAATEPRRAAVRAGRALASMAAALTRAGRVSPQVTGGINYVWLDQTVHVSDVVSPRAFLAADRALALTGRRSRGAALDHNLVQIGAPAAWRAGDTGAGVKVAGLDTGVGAPFPRRRGQIVRQRDLTHRNRRVLTGRIRHGTFRGAP